MPSPPVTKFEKWYRPVREAWPVILALVGIGKFQIDQNYEQEAKLDRVMTIVQTLDERLKREEKFRDAHPTGRQSGRDRVPDGLVSYPEIKVVDKPRRWSLSDYVLANVSGEQ